MVLPASNALLLPPAVENGAKVVKESLVAGEPSSMVVNKESQQKEKQISVDPMSLMKELSVRDDCSNLELPPPPARAVPIFPSPAKPPKLLSFSLPNSAASSPRFSTSISKKKRSNYQSQASPRQAVGSPNRGDSPVLSHRESQLLRRSKSCGEGRASAPSDEFDLWLYNGTTNIGKGNVDRGVYGGPVIATTQIKGSKENDDEFKCGALCLFLRPGFGRGKPVRARKEEADEAVINDHVISRTVSLEKFECASWASSAMSNSNFEEEGDSMNLYFDLPLELIRTSVNEANSPVASAFVFDKNTKGVLKNGGAGGRALAAGPRKSQESSRHVRFSTSTPTSYPASPSSCITPRLRKAREDFNAYLEAQS